jgi:hypothetical protein
MRFLSEDARPLALAEIMAGLTAADPGFCLDEGKLLKRGDELLGQLDLSMADDELFQEEIGKLQEEADDGQATAAAGAVAARLGSATAILAVQVLWQDRTAAQTLDLLAPLWQWLLANRRGFIHADGEGFYDGQHLILATR